MKSIPFFTLEVFIYFIFLLLNTSCREIDYSYNKLVNLKNKHLGHFVNRTHRLCIKNQETREKIVDKLLEILRWGNPNKNTLLLRHILEHDKEFMLDEEHRKKVKEKIKWMWRNMKRIHVMTCCEMDTEMRRALDFMSENERTILIEFLKALNEEDIAKIQYKAKYYIEFKPSCLLPICINTSHKVYRWSNAPLETIEFILRLLLMESETAKIKEKLKIYIGPLGEKLFKYYVPNYQEIWSLWPTIS